VASTASNLNINPRISFFSDSAANSHAGSRVDCAESEYHHTDNQGLASLVLEFTKQELTSYTEFRLAGISKASIPWMKRCSKTFWKATKGVISKERCDALQAHLSARYTDVYAPRKVMNFATAFLKYLAKTHFDTRYQAFDLFLEMPKGLKARKHVTSRIVTKKDVENLLLAIRQAYEEEEVDKHHYLNYRAIVLFSAYTGQRPQATVARLSIGQFGDALSQEKPVLDILPEQDKIRMQHYCPLHPQVVDAIKPLLNERSTDDIFFEYNSLSMWLKRRRIPLKEIKVCFKLSDLRKFCEQHGDIIQWGQSNRAYIFTRRFWGCLVTLQASAA